MSTDIKPSFGAGAKFLLVLFALMALGGYVDYFFYDEGLRKLLTGLGFTLLTYGAVKNGFSYRQPRDKVAHMATIIGFLLAAGAFLMRFL